MTQYALAIATFAKMLSVFAHRAKLLDIAAEPCRDFATKHDIGVLSHFESTLDIVSRFETSNSWEIVAFLNRGFFMVFEGKLSAVQLHVQF